MYDAINKLKFQKKKKSVMRFKPFTEKNTKKIIGICLILGRIRIRIHYPGSGSADPDLHQNEADTKHWNEV